MKAVVILLVSFCWTLTHAVGQTDFDTLRISLEAIDLSEDMSRLSSKNDEILLVVYSNSGEEELSKPVFVGRTVLNHSDMFENWVLSVEGEIFQKPFKVFLLEQDSDRTKEQLDPVLRVYHDSLSIAYSNRDYKMIKRFLEDEDLLGIARIELDDSMMEEAEFKGVHRLDEFHYRLIFEKINQK